MPLHARLSPPSVVALGLGIVALGQSGCAKEAWSLVATLPLPDFTVDATQPAVDYTLTVEVTPECFPADEDVAYGPSASAYVRALDASGAPGEPAAVAGVDLTAQPAVAALQTVDLTLVGQREYLNVVGVSGLSDPTCSLACLCRDRGICRVAPVLTFSWVSGGRVAGDRATVTALVAGSHEGDPPDGARLTLAVDGVGETTVPGGCSATEPGSSAVGAALLACALPRIAGRKRRPSGCARA